MTASVFGLSLIVALAVFFVLAWVAIIAALVARDWWRDRQGRRRRWQQR